MNKQKNNFLEEMAASSHQRVEQAMQLKSEDALLDECMSIQNEGRRFLDTDFIFFAEIKKSSPSMGQISESSFDVMEQAKTYVENGADVISILTEPSKFSGSLNDLNQISSAYPRIPTMRKDFLVNPYQISEAYLFGASGVLLIVAMLTDQMLLKMINRALEHQMFVLLEAFDEKDIIRAENIFAQFENKRTKILLGINSRDLRNLEVNFSRFEELSVHLPKDMACIAESGIKDSGQIKFLSRQGYSGVLIGTSLMKSENPKQLLSDMRQASSR